MTLIQEKQAPAPSQAQRASAKPSGFRADIQGLRALAVTAVVLYHLWPNRLDGGYVGVDVFFVISGFLITSHLISKPPRGLKDIGGFWMRRVKRLLPASFLVIIASVVGIWLLAPSTLWKDWLQQALAATFYFQNWFLAANKVDYLAEADAPSPFQHFWSLSVEEQFYFVWPVLIAAAIMLALRFGLAQSKMLLSVLGAVFAAGLLYSVVSTIEDSGVAYFSTFTRGWEFAAGALVAALGPAVFRAKSDVLSMLAAWVGLAAIGFSVLFFTPEMLFPGYIALLPVLGTALMILANGSHAYSPTRIFSLKPVQFIGDNSYAIYLWHWPLLVLLPFAMGHFHWYQKFGVVALTLLLAAKTQKLVEVKFRKFIDASAYLSAPRFLVAGSLVLAITAGGFYQYSSVQIERSSDIPAAMAKVEGEVGASCFGSKALTSGCENVQDETTSYKNLAPAPVVAKTDKPEVYADDCFSSQSTDFQKRPVCSYGKGDIKVALVGNSHAGQWFPAVEQLAEKNDWQVDTYVASRCAIIGEEQKFNTDVKSEGCEQMGDWVTEQIQEKDYDLVISSNRQSVPVRGGHGMEGSAAPAREAYEKLLTLWSDTGAEVVVIKDTPWPGTTLDNVPDCVAQNRGDLEECSGSAEKWIPADPQVDAVNALDEPGVVAVDMNDQLCRDERCYSVVGGLLAYWDHSHLTETFAQSLSPKLGKRMEAELNSKKLFK